MRRFVSILWFAIASSAVGAEPSSPSFDCTKATTKVERMICADSFMAGLDRQMADLFAKHLAGLDGDARAVAVAEQRAWLKSRVTECPPEAFKSSDCLQSLYYSRVKSLETRLHAFVGFECQGDRAILTLDAKTGAARSEEIAGNKECKLSSGQSVRASRKDDQVKLWVDRRIAYEDVVSPTHMFFRRVKIGGKVIEFCRNDFNTDKAEEDGSHCVPLAHTKDPGKIDYRTFPPDSEMPSADTTIVAYERDTGFCQPFLQKGILSLPSKFRAVPWVGEPSQLFPGLDTHSMDVVLRFQSAGIDHVMVRSMWNGGRILRLSDSGPTLVCRFMRAG